MPLVPENFLMTIRKVNHNDWKFFFYEEFADVFVENETVHADVLEAILPFMQNLTNNFRTQMVFRSVPFLVGFYFNKKEVRFYTPKLSQELFLLQQSEILDLNIPQVKDLRVHAEMAASLQVKNFPTVIEDLIRVEGLPDLLKDPKFQAIEVRSAEIVKKLLSFLNEYRPTLFEDVSDFGLGLTAQYALLRIHLLKFLAILPSLDHDKKGTEVKRILIEALSRFLKDNKKARRAKKRGQDRALPRTYTFGIKVIFYFAKLIPASANYLLMRTSLYK